MRISVEHLSSTRADQVDPAVEVDQVDPSATTDQVGPVVDAVEARPSVGKTVNREQRIMRYTQSTERMV